MTLVSFAGNGDFPLSIDNPVARYMLSIAWDITQNGTDLPYMSGDVGKASDRAVGCDFSFRDSGNDGVNLMGKTVLMFLIYLTNPFFFMLAIQPLKN